MTVPKQMGHNHTRNLGNVSALVRKHAQMTRRVEDKKICCVRDQADDDHCGSGKFHPLRVG